MRVVRQQGILEYLVARDGLFTIQNIFSLLQFSDFLTSPVSKVLRICNLTSSIIYVKEKPTWQLLKPRVKDRFEKMAENKEVLHSSFSYFNRYRCFIFPLLKQVLTISIAELNNENG